MIAYVLNKHLEIQRMTGLIKENEAKILEEKRILEKEKADLLKLQEQVKQ